MLDSWAGKSGAVVTCICAGVVGALLLTVWITSASAAPQAPGVELGPDHTQQGNPGQTVRYNHTLTNTGTTTDTFLVEASSTQRWPVELIDGIYPTEALTLSLKLSAQVTASFQVSLTIPPQVGGVTEITVVTATSQLSPTVQDAAIDKTIVPCKMYLPLVMKRWPPIPYQPTLDPVNNPDGDGNYSATWTEQPLRLANTYTLQEATDAAFTTGLRDVCTTPWQSCAVSDNPPGTYYYRVQGHNTWGYSAWSNIQTVTVLPPTPTPYNLRAQDIVLQLSDMPPGYALESEGPVEFSDNVKQMGVVDGYETEYFNEDLVLFGTPYVNSIAAVFMTAQGAHSYIRLIEQNMADDPELTPISSPTLGDETVACKAVFEEEGYRFIAYFVFFRKGNIVAGIATLAWSPVASFDDTLSFAEIMLAKIERQTEVDVQAIDNSDKSGKWKTNDISLLTVSQPRVVLMTYKRRLRAIVETAPRQGRREDTERQWRIGDDRVVLRIGEN